MLTYQFLVMEFRRLHKQMAFVDTKEKKAVSKKMKEIKDKLKEIDSENAIDFPDRIVEDNLMALIAAEKIDIMADEYHLKYRLNTIDMGTFVAGAGDSGLWYAIPDTNDERTTYGGHILYQTDLYPSELKMWRSFLSDIVYKNEQNWGRARKSPWLWVCEDTVIQKITELGGSEETREWDDMRIASLIQNFEERAVDTKELWVLPILEYNDHFFLQTVVKLKNHAITENGIAYPYVIKLDSTTLYNENELFDFLKKHRKWLRRSAIIGFKYIDAEYVQLYRLMEKDFKGVEVLGRE